MRSDINHTSGLASQQAARIEAIDTISRLRKEAREEISRLIQFLDLSDEYAMTELEDDDDREEVGDTGPSLGSFDRMVNQEKSYRQACGEFCPGADAELDKADDEPALGSLDRMDNQ